MLFFQLLFEQGSIVHQQADNIQLSPVLIASQLVPFVLSSSKHIHSYLLSGNGFAVLLQDGKAVILEPHLLPLILPRRAAHLLLVFRTSPAHPRVIFNCQAAQQTAPFPAHAAAHRCSPHNRRLARPAHIQTGSPASGILRVTLCSADLPWHITGPARLH